MKAVRGAEISLETLNAAPLHDAPVEERLREQNDRRLFTVFEALKKVDNAILKLDAPTDAQAALVNRPSGEYHVEEVVENLLRFEGAFVLQTMFLKGPSWATEDWVEGWLEIVRKIRPREIMVYTIDRETPLSGLGKYTVEEMRSLVQPLIDEGFTVQIKG
jgi:wyosine [tRNA(Phe)-imidazoG37] synthetase (radical SAM superfamily)